MKNDIADVVSSYVTLKRAGSNMTGLCPFHNEKTPSFIVFNAAQNFHCFGCGAGGDVVTFIRRIENLEYIEAIKFLAKRAGITVPEDEDRQRGGARKRGFFTSTGPTSCRRPSRPRRRLTVLRNWTTRRQNRV